jgi:hypothetical protein
VSEAKSIIDELMIFEFVISLVIWLDILGQVKIVNKILQDPKMDLNASASSIGSLITFLEKYRTNGFENAKLVGMEIVKYIGGTANFKGKRPRNKKKKCLTTKVTMNIQLVQKKLFVVITF